MIELEIFGISLIKLILASALLVSLILIAVDLILEARQLKEDN